MCSRHTFILCPQFMFIIGLKKNKTKCKWNGSSPFLSNLVICQSTSQLFPHHTSICITNVLPLRQVKPANCSFSRLLLTLHQHNTRTCYLLSSTSIPPAPRCPQPSIVTGFFQETERMASLPPREHVPD